METRALALALVAAMNGLSETLSETAGRVEELLSGDDDEGESKPKGRSGPAATKKAAPAGRPKKGAKEEEADDEYSEDDIVDAVKAAQKVLERADIVKILKSKGKAARATEVDSGRRGAVIDALQAAIDDAA